MPEVLPSFMQYAALENHMMHLNLDKEAAGPSQTELQCSTAASQQPMQGQQALQNHVQQQDPEQMRQEIRQQIEYYFR